MDLWHRTRSGGSESKGYIRTFKSLGAAQKFIPKLRADDELRPYIRVDYAIVSCNKKLWPDGPDDKDFIW